MSEHDNNQDQGLDNEDQLPKEDELATLKERAKMMGISFHPSIGVEALKNKIAEHVSKNEPEKSVTAPKSNKNMEAAARVEARNRALKLVRCRITCMNPNKREWEGEIFTAGNSAIGTIKKMVPFNTVFHVPQILLNMIDERKCQVFYSEKSANGQTIRKGKLIKEFGVEILPSLTEKELKALAQRQAMAAGTSEE